MADTSESSIETETDSSIYSAADSNANANVPDIDIPMPTENGGFSHTTASRAKISAANKGKTPWNKGKSRSEEVKKRIAEGVKRKNREKFLQKLEDMGLTEEEYENQKKEERKQKDAERKARRTENGGYRPTDETREKISKILKEKHAKGEIKKRKYEGPFRKGFSHSEETKEKIRESLRKKWAEDPEYAANMRKGGTNGTNITARAKISKTLKDKWQDPKFREKMIKSMKKRKTPTVANSKAQREKISEAMKKKWQDASYRQKAIEGMEKYRDNLPPKPQKMKTVTRTSANAVDRIIAMTPITIGAKKIKRSGSKVKVSSATAGVHNAKKKKVKSKVKLASTAEKKDGGPNVAKEAPTKELKDDGDISRMREERRDLYDLLYGDEGDAANEEEESIVEAPSPGVIDLDLLAEQRDDETNNGEPKGLSNLFTGVADLDDDNLDDFDPYNLDDY